MEPNEYVVRIKCLSYEDAKKTRDRIYERMGYRGYIDKEKREMA
jgi:hypothetical protein